MKPFDDMLPEEKEPQHQELAALLRRAYRRPFPVLPPEQGQILARVRERVVRADAGDSSSEEILPPQTGVLKPSPLQPTPPASERGRKVRPFRFTALLAAAAIIVALIGTPLLLLGPRLLAVDGNAGKTLAGHPILTLTPDIARAGDSIRVALKNFTPSIRVALTRDRLIPIPIDGSSSIISVDLEGSASVDVSIGSDWQLGSHIIVGEDVKTHFTASSVLHIVGSASQTYDDFVAAHGIMFGFDAQHTHFNPFEGTLNRADVGRLTKKWAYGIGGSVISSPSVAGGVVYIGCVCGYVYALDAATGTKKWAYSIGSSQVFGQPAVVGGVVYIGSIESHTLYAFDATTGSKKWAYQASGPILSSPTVAGGTVYVGSDDNTLYALDAATGAKKWAYWTRGSIEASPAVSGGTVYVGSFDGNVYALDANTGARKWSYRTGNNVYNSLAVSHGLVYVGAGDGNVYALDAATGAKKWAYPIGGLPGPSISVPAVAGSIVYVSSHGNIYALDAATGRKQWSTPIQASSDLMVAGGLIFFGGQGYFYAIDAASGATKWSYRDGGTVDCPPVVADGVVYFGSLNGLLYAFHLPGG